MGRWQRRSVTDRRNSGKSRRELHNSHAAFEAACSRSLVSCTLQEHQADIPDDHCGAFFLEDVAKNNHATYAGIETIRRMTSADVPLLPPSTFCCLAVGDQAVSKGQQGVQAVNKVQILLCIVRLPAQGSDVLLTLNTPIFISEHSAAAQNAGVELSLFDFNFDIGVLLLESKI